MQRLNIVGQRPWGNWRRHGHSGIHNFSPAPDRGVAGLRRTSTLPDPFQQRYFFIFRHRTDRMPDSPAFRYFRNSSRAKGLTLGLLDHPYHFQANLIWCDLFYENVLGVFKILFDPQIECRKTDKKFRPASLIYHASSRIQCCGPIIIFSGSDFTFNFSSGSGPG